LVADGSTVGNGADRTVLSGGKYLDIHNLHVTGVTNASDRQRRREDRHRTVLSDSPYRERHGCGLGVQGSDITVQRTTMQSCGRKDSSSWTRPTCW